MTEYYKVYLDNGKEYIVSSEIHNIWDAMEDILSQRTIRPVDTFGLIVCSHIAFIKKME